MDTTGYPYPVRIPIAIPPEAQKVFRIGVAVLALVWVLLGAALGRLLPLDYAIVLVFLVGFPVGATWFLLWRHYLKTRFGIVLPSSAGTEAPVPVPRPKRFGPTEEVPVLGMSAIALGVASRCPLHAAEPNWVPPKG